MVMALNFGTERPTLGFLVAMPGFVAACVFFMCFANGLRRSERGTSSAYQGSWLKYFHFDPVGYALLSGTSFTAMGVVAFALSLAGVVGNWEWVFLICIGLGCYVGSWFATVFQRRN